MRRSLEEQDLDLQRAIRLSAAEYRRQNPGAASASSASPHSSSHSTGRPFQAAGRTVAGQASSGSTHKMQHLKVGDSVRPRPGLERPLNGWGPVDPYDVGKITRMFPGSPAICSVSFGSKTDPLGPDGWTCSVADLVRLDKLQHSSVSTSLSDSSTKFDGDLVDTAADQALAAMLQQQQQIESQIQQQRLAQNATSSAATRSLSSSSTPLRQESINSITLNQKRAYDEKEAAASLDHIVATCMQTGSQFLDPGFPTTLKSLYGMRGTISQQASNMSNTSMRVTSFRRASHARRAGKAAVGINPRRDNWVVFRSSTPSAEDIQQGALGDCYFLSALACIARYPDLIKNLFVGPTAKHLLELDAKISPYGCYQIRLCKDGEWTIYTIDDMLPTYDDGRLAYTVGERLQLWPALIEKALAKAHGSYAAIASGNCNEALSILTGSPTDSFKLTAPETTKGNAHNSFSGDAGLSMDNFCESISDTNLLWINLEGYQAAGFVMACACHVRPGDSQDRYKEIGLQTSHAYSLLQVSSVRISGSGDSLLNGQQRLVQLRNPWGRFGWKGDWGVSSDKWNQHPHVRQALEYYATSDEEGGGVFWMSIEDFHYHFTRLDVCRIRSSAWSEVRIRSPLRNTNLGRPATRATIPAFRLEVFDSTPVEFCLHQISKRGLDTPSDHASFGLIIVRTISGRQPNEEAVQYAASSSMRPSPYVRCDAQLEAGRYLCVPICFNAAHSSADAMMTPRETAEPLASYELRMNSMHSFLVLALHSGKPVLVSEDRVTPREAALALISRVKNEGNLARHSDGSVNVYTLTDSAGAYVCVDVVGSRNPCNFSLDLKGSQNLVSTRMSLQTKDVIPSNYVQLVQAATTLGSEGWAYRSSMQWVSMPVTESHEPGVFSPGLHEPVPTYLIK